MIPYFYAVLPEISVYLSLQEYMRRLCDMFCSGVTHSGYSPGFKRHITKYISTISYTCLIHREFGTENRYLNRQPWFTSFFSTTNPNPNNPTRIFPKWKKKKEEKKCSNDITPHHCSRYIVYNTQPNHPIILVILSIYLYSHNQHTHTVWATIYITKFILCLRLWIVMLKRTLCTSRMYIRE